MKSATRSPHRKPSINGFPDDDDDNDVFGVGWPDDDGFGGNNDPWSSNVVAQAWPSQPQWQTQPKRSSSRRRSSNLEWTSTTLDGFPEDPFVLNGKVWEPDIPRVPTPQKQHQQQKKQQQQHPMRMSDEDWLPAPVGRGQQHAAVLPRQMLTWGSVAQGRSEESDDWQTDPLSLSQDGLSGQNTYEAPLGTEARPIEVDDIHLDEREAEMLHNAERKRLDTVPTLTNLPASRRRTSVQSVSPPPPPPPPEDSAEEEVSPRKGIMRLFGGRRKKKGGSEAGSSDSVPLGTTKQRLAGRQQRAAAATLTVGKDRTPPARSSPIVRTAPSADQSTVSAVTNPTFATRDMDMEANARIMQEQRDRMLAQKRGETSPLSPPPPSAALVVSSLREAEKDGPLNEPFGGGENFMALSSATTASSVLPPVASMSYFGDPFLEEAAASEDIIEYVDNDPSLDHLAEDASSTESRRDGDSEMPEEKKDDEDFAAMNGQQVYVEDHYQPKYAHQYDLSAPPPPPPPPPPARQTASPNRPLSPQRTTNKAVKSDPESSKSQQRAAQSPPQHSVQTQAHQKSISLSGPSQPPRIKHVSSPQPNVPATAKARVAPVKSMFERRERQLSMTPPRNRVGPSGPQNGKTALKEKSPLRKTDRARQKMPADQASSHIHVVNNSNVTSLRNRRRPSIGRSASPMVSLPALTMKNEIPTKKLTVPEVSEKSSTQTGPTTPGMAARLRERQLKKMGRFDLETHETVQPLRNRLASKQSIPSIDKRSREKSGRLRQPSTPDSRAREQLRPLDDKVTELKERSLTPLRRRQARLSQQMASQPSVEKLKKPTPPRKPLQTSQVYEGIKGSDSIGSVGSDIARLRSMRRSKISRSRDLLPQAVSSDYSTSTFDENDPMQRASMRLLSKQVVPIQSLFRRYLALREAFTRMWAVIVLQAMARRFLTKISLKHQNDAASLIQALYRGGRVRDQVLLEHCCALEIQRCVRGYLATLSVYEEIYQITLVQSAVRRKQAIDLATDRLVFIIQLQSLARGYLRRKRNAEFHAAAIRIQKKWRGSFQRLCYELDLLDIVIVQSTVRRTIALRRVATLRETRDQRAATQIQTFWRCRSVRLAYQVDLFDIVIVQSAVRRHFAARHVGMLRRERHRWASTKIQSSWRCHAQRLKYQMELFDIVLVQSAVRRMLACRVTKEYRRERREWAAVKIQTEWKCITQRVGYQMDLLDIVTVQTIVRRFFAVKWVSGLRMQRHCWAATKIQTAWRRLCQTLVYQMDLYDIVVAQSLARRLLARRHAEKLTFERRHASSVKIQSFWRSIYYRWAFQLDIFNVIIIQSTIRQMFARKKLRCLQHDRDERAATVIQAAWRCTSNRLLYQLRLLDIVVVQCQARVWFARKETNSLRAKRNNEAAIKIQSTWRCYDFSVIYRQYLAARKIQAAWRRYDLSNIYRQYLAGRKIQTAWRKCSAACAYKLALFSIITVQSVFRKRKAQQAFESMNVIRRKRAATTIQKTWRCYSSFMAYQITLLSAVTIQSLWRGQKSRKYVALFLQSRRHVAATMIQSAWRCYTVRSAFVELLAAITLQSNWRRYRCEIQYRATKCVITIQSCYRRHVLETAYKQWKAATKIQALWRAYDCTMNYLHYLADVLTIQRAVRHWIDRQKRMAEAGQAAVLIQSVVRMHIAKRSRSQILAVSAIQSTWRQFQIREKRKLEYSAILIQKTWRGFVSYADYMFSLADIVLLQSVARRFLARKARLSLENARLNYAATKFQSLVRMRHAQKMMAAITIQSHWRNFIAETEYFIERFENRAATIIQSSWRRFVCFSKFVIALDSAICIQATYRGHRVFSDYEAKVGASLVIQAAYSNRLLMLRRMNRSAIGYILSTSDATSQIERFAATQIQKTIRGMNTRKAFDYFLAARKIQSAWRASKPRGYFKCARAARKIQAAFRGRRVRHAYVLFVAARKIQAVARGTRICKAYKLYIAARKVQALVRGHRIRVAYVLFKAARKIQALWRGHRLQLAYKVYVAARKIQTCWRRHTCVSAYTVYIAARKIETCWRRHACSSAYFHYRSARCIQAKYRSHVASSKFAKYLAARRIQSFWRARSTHYAYKVYRSSRLIQAKWRGTAVRIAYRIYRAASSIQNSWRRSQARGNLIQMRQRLKEYCAAILIQSVVRRKAARLSFVAYREIAMAPEIAAATVVQKSCRGYLVRSAGYCFVQWKFIAAERKMAAITIQRYCRGFSARENYWQKLGSIILIQGFARRWKAEEEYNKIYGATLVLQSLARVLVAKQELKRRQFILSLVQTMQGVQPKHMSTHASNQKSTTAVASGKTAVQSSSEKDRVTKFLSEKTNKERKLLLQQKKKEDEAARVLQRFFAMVKREVDLAIQAEKKRRRKKKKKKRRKESFGGGHEDELLESIWDTVEKGSRGLTDDEHGQDSRSNNGKNKNSNGHRPKLPPEYANRAPLTRPRLEEDTQSFISASSFHKVPQSRMGLPIRVIDEDYCLETAWMDAEISVAKRRTTEAVNRRHC